MAWLLGEPSGRSVRPVLEREEHVFSSALTIVEVERAILRGLRESRLDSKRAGEARTRLSRTSEYWTLLRLDREVLDRAGRSFPEEPIRTLDALHLSSALQVGRFVEELSVLSLDDRIRASASALGFPVLPGA